MCSATLEETVEQVGIELERHGISKSWPPEREPNKHPYTNNRVDDFIGLVSPCKIEFQNAFYRHAYLLRHDHCTQQHCTWWVDTSLVAAG